MQDFERDPLFKMDDIHDISKEELRERTMEKVILERKRESLFVCSILTLPVVP